MSKPRRLIVKSHISLNQRKHGWYETQIIIGEAKQRNKGFGTFAIKLLLDFAHEKHIDKIFLLVRPDNHRAIYAYKKCGFLSTILIYSPQNKHLGKLLRMKLN